MSFKAITDFWGSETQIEISPNLKLKIHYLPCADLNKSFTRIKKPSGYSEIIFWCLLSTNGHVYPV